MFMMFELISSPIFQSRAKLKKEHFYAFFECLNETDFAFLVK